MGAAISGCGGGGDSTSGTSAEAPAKRGGTIKIASAAEPTTLLPKKLVAIQEAQVLNQVLQGLYALNPDTKEVEPLLAEKVEESADLTEWTFHLRPGVKFSSGKALTSADVAFTIEEAKTSESYANLYEGITKVSTPDELTVVMKTKVPTPALPSILALNVAGIVPANYGGASEQEFGNAPVGTGPFELVSWDRGQQLILERNPNYWEKGLPLLDEVVYVNPASDISRVQQIKAGEVDLIAEPPFAQLPGLESTSNLRTYQVETVLGMILVNSKKALFTDPRAREAVNLAINREDITAGAWKGAGKASASFFPPTMLYAEEPELPVQDVAKAKTLLAEAVKATGEQPNYTLFVEAGAETSVAATQVMQENLEEIGMKLTIQQLDPASFYEPLAAGEYDLNFINASSAVYDPVEWTNSIAQTDSFWTAAENTDEVAALVEEANVEVDPKKREELYGEIQQKVYEGNNLITTSSAPTVWIGTDQVSGFETGPTGIYDLREVGLSE
ncbi:MAG TPA: ABC transporter substrate-binding protein [Solirubrobacterales bacterium]|nr:ABC transporter substrate-binding protein [Solirubrobacterales bacterium]